MASRTSAAKEQRWHNVADEVRGIVQVLRSSLGSNDETAAQSLQRAKDSCRQRRLSLRGDDDELVRGLSLNHWPGDAETILEVGDLEVTRILAVRHDLFTFETADRGRRATAAVFSSARDARRYMIMDLCKSFRFHTRMAPLVMKELAAGSELEDGPTGHRLSWSDSEATFYDRSDAVIFSWVIDAEPAAIVESYQHPSGEPLFDLGLSAIVEEPERPRGRVMDPPAIGTPPADDEEVDHVTVDAVLSELGWDRCPPSEADVLRVGEPRVGRAIAYRQSQFVYESVIPPDHRHARCTFSSAGAARRFMIMELGHILRLRTSLPRIQPNRLAPGCAIEKGPTGFDVAWPGGRATFPIGYSGHQDALNFSWVAMAELADIAASYRHPRGEPLFELSNQPGG